jgi:hypothetical protein
VTDSTNTVGAASPALLIESCGLTVAPVPESDSAGCAVEFALMVSVVVCAPSAFGANATLTAQVEFAASVPPSWQVVVHGNSPVLLFVTLATGTGPVPVFQSVMATAALVRPTPVVGNVRLPHVMTNVDGVVVVEGVVVLLEQPETSNKSST